MAGFDGEHVGAEPGVVVFEELVIGVMLLGECCEIADRCSHLHGGICQRFIQVFLRQEETVFLCMLVNDLECQCAEYIALRLFTEIQIVIGILILIIHRTFDGTHTGIIGSSSKRPVAEAFVCIL